MNSFQSVKLVLLIFTLLVNSDLNNATETSNAQIGSLKELKILTKIVNPKDIYIRDQRKSIISCAERDPSNIFLTCPKNCTTDSHCSEDKREECICFGECGFSCINKLKAYCVHPGHLNKGKVVYVGSTGLYELQNLKEKVPVKGHILFECNEGYSLINGPYGKICEEGNWEPAGEPRCEKIDSPGFHWLRTGRSKRRAIKTGGSSSIVRSGNKGPASGTGLGPRRGMKKKGSRTGEGEEYESVPVFCDSLEELDFLQFQVIQHGDDYNETFSNGAVVKVSCTSGHGVNVPNETVRCENGKWRPKIPQCSALPCKTPYIYHGVFYEGSKPLYFQEVKRHKTVVDVKCKKGYLLRGPAKFHCWYGEWDVQESPECVESPCEIPTLDFGTYFSNYRPKTSVQHGIEVDYTCEGEYRKLLPGIVRCELGQWKPNRPFCVHPSVSDPFETAKGGNKKGGKGDKLIPAIKRSCGSPPKEKGAYVYEGGLPVNWNTQFSFQDSSEVIYRCSTIKPKAKNRWKIICDDGSWTGIGNLTCDGDAPLDQFMSLPILSMINSSCTFNKIDPNVVSFFDDQIITEDSIEYPHGTSITSRCVDIGKYRLEGAVRRKCLSGQWMGITPKCEGLSQVHDYALDKSPTILFRYSNGAIVQSTDGDLVVYPGTNLHMECIWIRKYGKPRWDTSNKNKEYPEGWAEGKGRDKYIEYRLTIDNAQSEDSGTYSCVTPTRHSHQIKVIVKAASCDPLLPHADLEYSTNDTILGTRVSFKCKYMNSLIGVPEIFCSETGRWSAPLPHCENVECHDISLLPAMAPLAYTSITRNGTLKKNETAPPKITVGSTNMGGKVSFSCQPGYMIEGSSEAYCLGTGEWSASIPLCKEIVCPTPPELENGVLVNGSPPYKAGDLATFECESGFKMEGQSIIACQDNGKWSKSNGMKCTISCPYPGAVIGGRLLTQVKFNYEIGEKVEIECATGFVLHGSRILHCLKTGKWSATIPNCTPLNYDHVSNFQIQHT